MKVQLSQMIATVHYATPLEYVVYVITLYDTIRILVIDDRKLYTP